MICFNQIYAGALRGVGDATMPTVIMLISFVVFRQIYLAVSMSNRSDVRLVYWGYPVGWLFALLFTVICAALIVDASPAVKALVVVMPLLYAVFYAVLCTVIAVKMPVMTWSNEVTPIKQSGGVAIALFGGWAICAVMSRTKRAFFSSYACTSA